MQKQRLTLACWTHAVIALHMQSLFLTLIDTLIQTNKNSSNVLHFRSFWPPLYLYSFQLFHWPFVLPDHSLQLPSSELSLQESGYYQGIWIYIYLKQERNLLQYCVNSFEFQIHCIGQLVSVFLGKLLPLSVELFVGLSWLTVVLRLAYRFTRLRWLFLIEW